MRRPSFVAHADWSTAAAKRRIALARADSDRYVAGAAHRAGDPATLLPRLAAEARDGSVLVGFDFPIGVPRGYAGAVGVASYRELLALLATDAWLQFFDVADTRDEVSLRRPFYPRRPGGTTHAHLFAGLRAQTIDELRRRCDRADAGRRAAAPLFWTLGAQQVGRAAIAGWRDVLLPAVRSGDATIWPFDGPLDHLVGRGGIVIVETYPADAYRQLGLVVRRKGDREARAAIGPDLRRAARELGVELSEAAEEQIDDGFADDDDFDAFVGLLGMLAVVLEQRPPGEPRDDAAVCSVEGWIFGQPVDEPGPRG